MNNSSIFFTMPVNETVSMSFGATVVEITWKMCNNTYSVTGTGLTYEDALEVANLQFHSVMNYLLRIVD